MVLNSVVAGLYCYKCYVIRLVAYVVYSGCMYYIVFLVSLCVRYSSVYMYILLVILDHLYYTYVISYIVFIVRVYNIR